MSKKTDREAFKRRAVIAADDRHTWTHQDAGKVIDLVFDIDQAEATNDRLRARVAQLEAIVRDLTTTPALRFGKTN